MQNTVRGMRASADTFTRETRVECHQIGAAGRVRLSALLRMEQETGEEHMDALGLPYERLLREGVALLLTSNSVRVRRMPQRNEQLHICTRPRGVEGVRFYRDFSFRNGEEELLFIRQASVCVDAHTHKPLRPDALYRYHVFREEKLPAADRVKRIRCSEALRPLGERPIRYSDLDYNQHLTNTIYGDIVEDFLPADWRDFSTVQIDYVGESQLGDSLHIFGGEQDGSYVLLGKNQSGVGFAARVSRAG